MITGAKLGKRELGKKRESVRRDSIIRWAAALALAGAGVSAFSWAGSPLLGAIIAFLAGMAVLALIFAGQAPAPPVQANPDGQAEPESRLPGLEDVLSAIEDPRLIVRNGKILYANPAAKTLLGQHIEGVDVRLAIRHPAAAERLIERHGKTEEDVTSTELAGLGEPGRRWQMTASRLVDGSRFVRLTDRSQVHAAEQMRVDFVANASHELRTPLATLLGFLETLQEEDAAGDPKTRAHFLKIMFDEASRMRNLVEDLMSLSRIEADRFTAPRDPIDLLPLIDEIRASLAQLIESRQSSLIIDNRASGELVIVGDRPQIAQLLNNLLANALKYGRPGTPVRIRLDDAGPDMIRINVIDQGEGIEPEHLPRLTERFYRVDPGRSRSVGGTGLGLAIVKHIVGRHRGRLEIKSKVGVGTSLRVYLPRAGQSLSSKSHETVTEASSSRLRSAASSD